MMHIAQVVVEKTREAITSRNNSPTPPNYHKLTSLAHVFVFFPNLTCFFIYHSQDFPLSPRLSFKLLFFLQFPLPIAD